MRHGYLSRPMITLLLLAAWPAASSGQQATAPASPEPESRAVVIGQLEEATPLEPRDDAKKRSGVWERLRLGATVGFMSSTDFIRSKSANSVVFRDLQINASGIAYEPRVVANGRISMSPIRSGANLDYRVVSDFIRDPRKDSGGTLDASLEETLWLDLGAAWDIKTWRHGTLLVQMDVGYYSGDYGPIEVAVDIPEQAILNPLDQDLTADDPFANYQYIYPTGGTLTQIPSSLSVLWQFRPRSPFRPYFGLGLGYLSLDLEESGSLKKLNEDLAGIDFVWTVRQNLIDSGSLPAETITVEATEDYLWLAHGGLEYNLNRNWSVYFSTKYLGTTANLRTKALGYYEFGAGIDRNQQVDDVDGVVGEESLVQLILSLPVSQAVELVDDIAERSSNPIENERSYYTTFPVVIGSPVTIEVPNPTLPGGTTQIQRQGKLFIQGGEVRLESFSVGMGFRYRY